MNEQKNRSDLIWKWPTVCFPFVVDSFSVLLFLSPLFFFASRSVFPFVPLQVNGDTSVYRFLCGWFIDYS